MADELDPKKPNQEYGRTSPEEMKASTDEEEEEFEDIDESDSDEDDLES
jgi:hypothetical protein